MIEAQFTIYTLVDPRDGAVRYVGLSKDVEQRYYYHCNASDNTVNAYNWLKELKDQGLKPLLFPVEEGLNGNIAYERETYWMNFFLDEHEPLLNYIAPIRRKKVICSS